MTLINLAFFIGDFVDIESNGGKYRGFVLAVGLANRSDAEELTDEPLYLFLRCGKVDKQYVQLLPTKKQTDSRIAELEKDPNVRKVKSEPCGKRFLITYEKRIANTEMIDINSICNISRVEST